VAIMWRTTPPPEGIAQVWVSPGVADQIQAVALAARHRDEILPGPSGSGTCPVWDRTPADSVSQMIAAAAGRRDSSRGRMISITREGGVAARRGGEHSLARPAPILEVLILRFDGEASESGMLHLR
jgi:hypothetical protein